MTNRIRKGDMVFVNSGKDNGKKGEVIKVIGMKAIVKDIVGIAKLVTQFAERGLMLHRSLEDLYENVRDFHVAVDDEDNVVGVCGLNVVWADLAEVYSLAVHHSQQGKGLGSRLVEATIEDARELGIAKLMSLTYEQRFFERLGFRGLVTGRISGITHYWWLSQTMTSWSLTEVVLVRI